MEWLLPKKDQERLSLHRYLNAQESNAVLIKDIMADLGWSRYMVLQNVETLRIDCQQIGDGNVPYLTLVDSNRALQIEQLQTISDTALLGYYIRNSLRFDVLMDIFFEVAQSNETIAGADVKIMDRLFWHREVPHSENFSKPGFQLKTA